MRVRPQIDAKTRARMEKAVEKLIAALDMLDDIDQDTQVDDGPIDDKEEEPSLGSLPGAQNNWAGGEGNDLEDEHDGAEPDNDDEPSLGSFDRMTNQEKSYRLNDGPHWLITDAEVEHDGREPDADMEDDPAENGIADQDGLREQIALYDYQQGRFE